MTQTGTGAADDRFEAVRRALLEAARAEAAFSGWSGAALREAAKATEIGAGEAEIAFPRGVVDVLDLWSQEADTAMEAAYAGADPAPQRIRDKITFCVRARIEALAPHKEAARRAAATLALPLHARVGARLVWRTADAMWRAIGDTSTDFNWYSKRAILSGVYASTLARWFADDSEDAADTWAFLDRRIGNVMQFEKTKARVRKAGIDPAAPIRALAKLRYRG